MSNWVCPECGFECNESMLECEVCQYKKSDLIKAEKNEEMKIEGSSES